MCASTHVSTYACVHVCIRTSLVPMHAYLCMCAPMHTCLTCTYACVPCMCTHAYVPVHVCTYACVHLCMCAPVHVCTYA